MKNNEPAQGLGSSRLARLAWLPIPLLAAAIVAARVAGLQESYSAETLRLVLSLTFYTVVSLGTLFLIGRSFLASGTPGLLLLECGVVLWSLAGTVGDAASHGDANVNVTIFNSTILLAGLCHLAGAILSLRPQRPLRPAPLWLGAGCVLALGALGLVTWAALAHWLPVFFIPGQGGTPVRYWVLLSAIAMFMLSAGLLLARQGTARAPFASWYARALLLLAVGLFGVMIQLSLGTVVNWLGRTAQWLGGVYLLLAAIAALRESNLPLLPPPEKSRPGGYRYGVAITIVLAAAAVRLAFLPGLGSRSPYVTFYPAVVLAALYGGLRSGFLATALATLLAAYFWLPSNGRLAFADPADWLSSVVFLICGSMIACISEAMHRASARAAAAETQALLAEKLREAHATAVKLLEQAVEARHQTELANQQLRQEIAERQRAEEALRENRARLQTALASMTDAVFISDAQGRFLEFNDAFATFHRFQTKDECARTFAEYPDILDVFLADGTLAPLTMWAVPRALRGETVTNAEYTLRRKDTGETWVGSYSFAPIRDKDGLIIGSVVAGRDITDLKRAELELRRRAEELKTANAEIQTSRLAALSLVEDALEARKASERVNADLQKAVQALDTSRIAALNLMEDAVKARKQAEQTGADLYRLNRTLKALSDSNQAMMRFQNEDQYLEEVCRIVVKDCGHAMVWVGFAEHDEAQTIRPAASAGFEAGYLNTLKLTWAETERGRGPTGTAIRTGKTCHCKNMLTDPAFAPWRAEALKRGYASSLVLPLLADGKAFGAVTIYSTQPDPFSQDEVNLLGELAADLTQGIMTFRLRSARAQAEEALKVSETRYRTLFETMSEGFCLDEIICDAHGKPRDLRYLAVNPAFERQTGLKATDVVGRTVLELFPQTEPLWLERYGKVALTGEPAHFEAWFAPLARWFAVSAFRTDPGRFAVTFTDVTERKRAEEQLRLLSTAVESADNGIAITDRKGQILWINPAFSRLTGYTQPEAIGQNPRILKSGQHPPEFYRQMWSTLLRGEPWQGELVNRRKDGSLYTEEMTVTPVRAAGADITHFVAIKQDVTARKRAEQRTDLLADTASRLLTTDSPQSIVNELCEKVMAFLDCQAFFNFLVDEHADKLHLNACAGIPPEDLSKVEWLDYGTAICGCAARDGCRIVAEDIPNTADPRTELLKSFGILAYACHPLTVQERFLGTLSFGTRTRTRFTEEDLSLMKAVADQVAIAMDRQQAQAALKELNEELEERVAVRTAALHAAERYARSLLEASLDPLVTISHEGRITDVNLATELVTGVPRDRLVGSSFSSYFTEPDKADAGYQRVMAHGLVRDYPLTIRHASGHTTDVLYNATVYRNEAGEVQGVFAAARDITERKQAERRRDFTNALLALFAQKSSATDYLNSVVETIRQWTGAQALGVRLLNEQQEIPYESWAGFEPGFLDLERRLSLEHDQCLCIRAISGALDLSDRPLLTPGGSFRSDDAIAFAQSLPAEQLAHYRGNCMKFGFSSLAIVPIRYRDQVVGALHLADRRPGQFPLALVEFIESMTPLIGEAIHRFQTEAELAKHRDHLGVLVKQRTSQLETANAQLQSEIVERRHAQEALQQTAESLQRSNRDLEQFAYVASHDLQEPLRAVGGYVRLLERRLPQNFDAKAHEWVNGAVDGASRMERLITDLLAFSRVGTRSDELVPADLSAVLDDALHNLQTSIKAAQATIVRQPLPTLTVDATQMMQLFQNLIGNAIKFRGERPPEIRVGARRDEGRWVFSVSDNGIGIEPQYFERIFQIFQRLHTRKQYPGTGIGLAICKRIVERHHGEIWVESKPNEGTTFFFSLPPSGTSLTPGFRCS